MIRASSSGDHLLCFFAGDSAVCGGMLRFPPPLPGRGPVLEPGAGPETLSPLVRGPPAAPRRGDDNGPAPAANGAGGGPHGGEVTAADEAVLGRSGWVGDTEDSLESGPLRREAISTMGGVSPGVAYRGRQFMGARSVRLGSRVISFGRVRGQMSLRARGFVCPARFVLGV
jgi:hypothetical protein